MLYRVRMDSLTVDLDNRPSYRNLGGKTLASRVIHSEVPAGTGLLGPGNKVVLAAGLLAGTGPLYAGRLSLCTRSPVTGQLKTSSAGGEMGNKLGRLGIKGIILEGLPAKDTVYVLYISSGGAVLEELAELKGCTTYDTVARLQLIFGQDTAISCLGTAGSNRILSACAAFTDQTGHPVHYAGRRGLAAVMGSKGVKAIVVDDRGVSSVRQIVDSASFARLSARIAAITNELTLGEPRCLLSCNSGRFCAQSGKTYTDKADPVADNTGHKPFRQLSVLKTLNPPDCAAITWLCNAYGLDIQAIAEALAVAVSAGLLAAGNSRGMIELIHEVGQGTILGRVIGAGAEIAGKVLGVKSDDKDNRRLDSLAASSVSSPDSNACKVKFIDSTGLCLVAATALLDHPQGLPSVAGMCNALYGCNGKLEDYLELCWE